ncbi:hypothetical protein EVA_07950, partial [gut metagenome]
MRIEEQQAMETAIQRYLDVWYLGALNWNI